MEDLARLVEIVYYFFNRKFVIYGFELSFWGILFFVVLGSMIIWAIKEIFE